MNIVNFATRIQCDKTILFRNIKSLNVFSSVIIISRRRVIRPPKTRHLRSLGIFHYISSRIILDLLETSVRCDYNQILFDSIGDCVGAWLRLEGYCRPGKPVSFTSKPKLRVCRVNGIRGPIHFHQLKPNERLISVKYCQQLNKWKRASQEKMSTMFNNKDIKLFQDNDKPHATLGTCQSMKKCVLSFHFKNRTFRCTLNKKISISHTNLWLRAGYPWTRSRTLRLLSSSPPQSSGRRPG